MLKLELVKIAHADREEARKQVELLSANDPQFHEFNSYRWECEDAYSNLIRSIMGTSDQAVIEDWNPAYRTLRVRG